MQKFKYRVIQGTARALEEQMGQISVEGWKLHTSHVHYTGDGANSTRDDRVEMTWILEREELKEPGKVGVN